MSSHQGLSSSNHSNLFNSTTGPNTDAGALLERLFEAQTNGPIDKGIVLYGQLPEGIHRVDIESGRLTVRLSLAQLSTRLEDPTVRQTVLTGSTAEAAHVAFFTASQPYHPGYVSISIPLVHKDVIGAMTEVLNAFYSLWKPEPISLDQPHHDPKKVAQEATQRPVHIDHLPWQIFSRHPALHALLEIEGQHFVYELENQAVIAVPTSLTSDAVELGELSKEGKGLGITLEARGSNDHRHILCRVQYDDTNRDSRAAALIQFVESRIFRIRGDYHAPPLPAELTDKGTPPLKFSGDYLPTILRTTFPKIFALADISSDPGHPNALITHVDTVAWIAFEGSASASDEQCRLLRQQALANGIMSELSANAKGNFTLKFSVLLKSASDMDSVRNLVHFLHTHTNALYAALGKSPPLGESETAIS